MLYFSTKIKKILLWIPVVNVLLFFAQCRSLMNANHPKKTRALIICFSTIGVAAILQLCFTILMPYIQQCSGMIIVYLVPVVLNWSLFRLLQQNHEDVAFNVIPNKRKNIWIAVIAGGITAIIFVGAVIFQNFIMHIADQNGANDTSLNVLSRDDITEERDCALFAHTQTAYGNSSHIGSRYDDVDKTTVGHTFGKISGVYTVHATKTDAQVLKLTITSTLQSGNMELAIIVDGEYHCSVPINQMSQITLEDIRGKTVLVRLAGESAKAEISISRSCIK